jgi:hypothetical protein
MEHDQEVQHLRDRCQHIGLLADDLKKLLLALSEPKPKPQLERLVGLSFLATREGLPARCPDHACRRDGRCHALQVGEHACAPLWTSKLLDRYDIMTTGIELSAICGQCRDAEIHAELTQVFETPAPKAATRNRRKRSK